MVQYSFIIPVKAINDYIRESVPKILAIARDDYEIIIYPDADFVTNESWPRTRQIASPPGPAEKRSLAIRDAQGEILIFIDDDSYPDQDFLDWLEKDFTDKSVTAVGGPAITPPDDSFWQKISGAIFLSPLSAARAPERYVPIGERRFVDDWPSVNLSIRKLDFSKLGGFDCGYWPGEDTKLCLDIITKLNGKILYNPALIVCHHRREGLGRHLKQISGYGLHRGFFAKTYPATSLKLEYFVPSAFLLFIIFGAFGAAFEPKLILWYGGVWLLYVLVLCKAARDIHKHEQNFAIIIHALYYIFLTHLVYGFYFLKGFVWVRRLKSQLR